MATLGTLLFVLQFIGHWYSYETAADTCIPTVRGEPFVQFMENKNCEVDEKLLKLFNPESFNEFVASKSDANFMCIGFMDALNLVPEDLCSIYDPLSVIPDSNFCSNKKMMTTLGRIVNGSVFDNSNIVIVSNYTVHYCKVLCKDYNELCWAFGTIARVVLKQNSISTTAPATTEPTTAPTTEPPTSDPTTEPTTVPTIVTTEHPEFPSIINRVNTGIDDPGDDHTTNDMNALLDAYSAENGSDDNHKKLGDNKDTGDSQEVQSIPDTDGDSQDDDNNTTAISNIPNTSENATTTTTTNITTTENIPNVTTEEVPSMVPGDNNYDDYYFSNVVDNDDGDSALIGHTDDDYGCWHVTSILFFIVFFGVAVYLAVVHNRMKIKESASTYKPVKIIEAGLL